MIVCSCHGITDGDIRHAHGPDGPGRCVAGTGCGNCLPVVTAITEQCRDREPAAEDFDEPGAPRGDGSADLAPRG